MSGDTVNGDRHEGWSTADTYSSASSPLGEDESDLSPTDDADLNEMKLSCANVKIAFLKQEVQKLSESEAVNKCNALTNRVRHLTLENNDITSEVNRVILEKDRLDADNKALRQKVLDMTVENNRLSARSEESTKSTPPLEMFSTMQNVIQEKTELADRFFKEKVELADRNTALQNDLIRSNSEKANLNQEKDKLSREKARILLNKAQLQIDLEDSQKIVDALRAQETASLNETTELRQIISTHQQENTDLKTKLAASQSPFNQDSVMEKLARAITDLDLVWMRIFTCVHPGGYGTIQYGGATSTHKIQEYNVADDLFALFRDNKMFQEKYKNVRRSLIQHHQSHGRLHQGRGEYPDMLRKKFYDADGCRNTFCKYTD